MFQFLRFTLALTIGFCQSLHASPFPEWQQQSTKDYAKLLAESALKTNKGVSKEGTLSRIREAKAQQKWAVAIAELETLV